METPIAIALRGDPPTLEAIIAQYQHHNDPVDIDELVFYVAHDTIILEDRATGERTERETLVRWPARLLGLDPSTSELRARLAVYAHRGTRTVDAIYDERRIPGTWHLPSS